MPQLTPQWSNQPGQQQPGQAPTLLPGTAQTLAEWVQSVTNIIPVAIVEPLTARLKKVVFTLPQRTIVVLTVEAEPSNTLNVQVNGVGVVKTEVPTGGLTTAATFVVPAGGTWEWTGTVATVKSTYCTF